MVVGHYIRELVAHINFVEAFVQKMPVGHTN